MPRNVIVPLIWAVGILLAVLAIVSAGRIGLIPSQFAGNAGAVTLLALSWIATVLIGNDRNKCGN